ncbi:MAG: hypothetical protein U0559_01500 [Anaerolineae bacterium]
MTYTAIFNLPWGLISVSSLSAWLEFENHVKAMGQIKAESVDELQA